MLAPTSVLGLVRAVAIALEPARVPANALSPAVAIEDMLTCALAIGIKHKSVQVRAPASALAREVERASILTPVPLMFAIAIT